MGEEGLMEEERKAYKVHRVFQEIAHGYDGANERISLGMQKSWKKMLIRHIAKNVPPGEKVLDVCCGTGDIALMIGEKRRDLPVTGIDFSQAMLKVAKEKRDKKRCSQILFLEADAMELPFEDDTFGAAVISFGLRNTENYLRVLKEMQRVVKPGGYVYCLDSFVPAYPWVQPFYRCYFHYIMPFLGGGRKHLQEYRWLSDSTEQFLQPKELMRLFRRAGLNRVWTREKMFGACVMIFGRK